MLALRVTVPVASFRRPFSRTLRDTEPLPPPSTCYGFLLSLIGETNRESHLGVRVTSGLLTQPQKSTVLRTMFRQKALDYNDASNRLPDFQEILTGLDVLIWVCSDEETAKPSLEERVRKAIKNPASVHRFGALSLGESSHLVNDIWIVDKWEPDWKPSTFLLEKEGVFSLATWPDYGSNRRTQFAVGNIQVIDANPLPAQVPVIRPAA